MLRVAVLGANGQVGAEMCLLLSKVADLDVIAICRNRSGSAFLRWQGIACRHGRPADPNDAPRLFGDCGLILNFALAGGNPAQIRATEDQLIHNSFAFSPPEATVVYFSTQSVYGDPHPDQRIRWLNPYGRAKLVSEGRVRAASRRWRKRTFILRLGHVCGELQGISLDIRRTLREERVVLPAKDVPSNTVLTAAILDAVQEIAASRPEPGTYDLMNSPQWTWQQMYRYEAERSGVTYNPTFTAAGRPQVARLWRLLATAKRVAANRWSRELLAKLLAYAPATVSRRAQAVWYCQRARAEIGSLSVGPQDPPEHLYWVTNGKRPLPQRPTLELLNAGIYRNLLNDTGLGSWPADLADAGPAGADLASAHAAQAPAD